MSSPDLFPAPAGLRFERAVVDGDTVTFVLTATAPTARCPGCSQASGRVHSRYTRRLADLPGQGRAARLLITARRFFCPTPGCARRTFVERLPDLAGSHARAPRRLHRAHAAIGHAWLPSTIGFIGSLVSSRPPAAHSPPGPRRTGALLVAGALRRSGGPSREPGR